MLDDFQLDIVNSEEKNILVVASPGSGKTTVIINRAGHLIRERQVNPENIIIITFTRAAAENMRRRFKKIFQENRAPFFGTFHSFFYNILLKQYGSIEVISGSSAFYVIEKSLKRFMDEVSEDRVRDILSGISYLKTGFKTLEQLSEVISAGILTQCYNDYEEYKRCKGLMDFDDLQIKTLQLFRENSRILELYRQRFKYVLVDEFQDCDKMQLQLLKLLCEGNSIFAVGDEDQCIYGFRGARPDYMVKFRENFEGAVKKFLVKNYRSLSGIIEISVKLIGNNKIRNAKEITGSKAENGRITCEKHADERRQGERIAEFIGSMVSAGNREFSDFAVLYRTNMESRSLIDSFIRKKVPFTMIDMNYCFYDHFICSDLLSYLRLSQDMTDRASFLRIINRPFRYISKVNLEKIKDYPYKEDCIDILISIPALPFFQYKELQEFRKKLLYINKLGVEKAINHILQELGYNEHVKGYCSKNRLPEEDINDMISEFKEAIGGFLSISEFLSHVAVVQEKMKNRKAEEKEGVLFSTIHGVKGMEFKDVFIINCVDGTIPFHREGRESDVEEERRLFYVGITRTMENLYLNFPHFLKGRAATISPFIKECGIDIVADFSNEYGIGSRVCHHSLGIGEVTGLRDSEIEIKFTDGSIRTFNLDVLIGHKLLKKLA
ncbi:MAG: ATP-dependent helicase [Bacillota bacterium]|nr:ATP-dependent helicase [Bacillota bacterium]